MLAALSQPHVRINRWAGIGLALVLLLSLLSACTRELPEAQEIRVAMAQKVITLDPRYSTDAASHRVQELVHRGLIRLDEHFEPQADAAESWEQVNALTWRFQLREGLKFHDGSLVRASDVVATLQSILDPASISPLRAGFAAIERLEVEGARGVVIHLSRPDASLLTRLSMGILPARLAAKGNQARTIIGCGPFLLSRWDERGLQLKRVAKAATGKIASLRFVTVKDPVTRCLKLGRGEVDFTENDLPPHLLGYLRDQQQLSIATRPSTTFSYIGMNIKDQRLKDVRVRRALALAVDRSRLKKALYADLPVLGETVLTPGHWASSNIPATSFNPKRAAALLDEAGFKPEANGVRFTLNYRTSTDPARLRMATAIADMWGKVGVQVKVESLEWGGFYARIKRGDFQVFSLAWVGIVDPDIYRWILHSSMWPPKGANRGRYSSADVDRWLDTAAESQSRDEQKRLYARVQQRMAEDQVYIPLWYEPVIAVSGPRLSGFNPAPDGSLLGLLDARIGQ
ncbi:MAG: ABC transporter substrate-binding protein [Mariprofundaceae bacterium]|nr:ABC transporter substrate-binding protein [Mariprofundaceae bacterium]